MCIYVYIYICNFLYLAFFSNLPPKLSNLRDSNRRL